jgi:HlyD family secretion protein
MWIKSIIVIALTFAGLGCWKSTPDHYQGYVEGDLTFLSSPYSGTLFELKVQRGQLVKKGDLIFKLDPDPEAWRMKEAQAGLIQAQKLHLDLQHPRRSLEIAALQAEIEQINAKIKLAEIQVKRSRRLFEKHAGSQDSLERVISLLEELQHTKEERLSNLQLAKEGSRKEQIEAQLAQVQAAAFRLKQAQWQLAQKSVRAPADGIIFDTYYLAGEFVANQQPVASLLSPEQVRIEFFVPVEKLDSLHLQQEIVFSCSGCQNNNRAKITYISPEAEYIPPLVYSRDNADKLVFRVKAQILSAHNFKPGQPVTVDVAHE